MNPLALLGEEARVIALLIERLNQLPLHLADHRGCEPPGALDRLAVLVQIVCVFRAWKLVDLPRSDPEIVDVPLHRRLKVAHDDSNLHGLREDRLRHCGSLDRTDSSRLRRDRQSSDRRTSARTADVHSGGSGLEIMRHPCASGYPELFYGYTPAYCSGLRSEP